MKTIISLSGGMDSATLLGYCRHNGDDILAYSFLYGSKHNKYELAAAEKLAKHYGVKHKIFDLRALFSDINSNLMLLGGDIPDGHYEAPTMSQTVVPGRNHIFASILAGIAESRGFDRVALAVHAGDHHIYPDCRPEFINHLNQTILLQTEGKVCIYTPFLHLDKEKILKRGFGLDKYAVPYELTRTCYKDQELSCGRCGSCQERLEAWKLIGKEDPIEYE